MRLQNPVPAIVHLDYRIGNLVIDEATASVQAVLDWELATLGDPLLDLGNFLVSVPVRGRALTRRRNSVVLCSRTVTRLGEELAERYAEHTGAYISPLPWYEAMSLWKLAVLMSTAEQGCRGLRRSVLSETRTRGFVPG